MTFPKAFFQGWELLKQPASGNSLVTVDQFGNLMDRFGAQNKMDMIEIGFYGNQRTAAFANQIAENLFEPISNFIAQDSATIFDAPDNMVSQQIDRMRSAFKFIFHTRDYLDNQL